MDLFIYEHDRIYLIYKFTTEGLPDPKCHVHARMQGCPQRHRITLVLGGVEILSNAQGITKETKLYQLPCQRYNTGFVMSGKDLEPQKPSISLPKMVTMVYDTVEIEWTLNQSFTPAYDYGPYKKSCYVYSPTRINIL